jgi:hypothetical protein
MSIKRFMKKRYIIPAAIVATPLIIAIFVVFFGGVVMLLWNWLLPPLFGLPAITLLQGFGLFMLGRLLFGGFGMGGGGSQRSRRMTPEERARLRERLCRPDERDAAMLGRSE